MKKMYYGLAAAVLVCLAISTWLVFEASSFLQSAPQTPGREVVITIKPGSSFHAVAQELQERDCITNAQYFRILGKYEGKTASIKAGEFRLSTAWTPRQVLDAITTGPELLHKLVVREGLTWWQVGKLVEESGLATFKSFEKAVHDKKLLKQFNIPFDNAEGFLFPETYSLPRPRGKNAYPIVRTMLSAFWSHAGNKLWPDAPPSPEELKRTVILASMVERETGVTSERERIAGVFANRIRRGMLMQCDPTIIYGLGTDFDGNLTRKHLRDKSNPYNTYRHKGLPPGPICSPGFHALTSALHPEEHNYLYFVAKGDRSHYFSKSLREHNNAVRKYQLRR